MYFCLVRKLKKIVGILLSVLFFFLSTGVMLYQTHCKCSGISKVSFLAVNEFDEHTASEADCCSAESISTNFQSDQIQETCECDSPVFIFLKLSSHYGEDSGYEFSLNKSMSLQQIAVSDKTERSLPEAILTHFTSYTPPDTKKVGRTLVNFTHQYKIALFA